MPQASTNPTISIDTPTDASTFVAGSALLSLEGVTSDNGSVTGVTWTNDRGGSGSAEMAGPRFSITSSAGPVTVFSDTFNCGTTTAIVSNPPQIGTGWTEAVDTAGTVVMNCRPAGYAIPSTAPAAGNVIIYTLTPSPALAGTGFDFSITNTGGGTAGNRWGLIYRYTDANNYCAVILARSANNPDMYWVKKEASVFTTLVAAQNADPGSSSAVRLVRTGSTVEVFVGGVSKGTNADAFCDDNVTLGLGMGALGGVGTDTLGSDMQLDNVTVVDPGGAGGGITLQSGTNVITVTATDNEMNTGTDVLTVTYGGSDTSAPIASITIPTVAPTDATATATQTISGTATDNVGVTSVTWSNDQGGSGTATCALCGASATAVDWTFPITLTCSGGGTANVITVTPNDTAANPGVADVLTFTCTSADVTDPVVTITSDCGSGAGANCSIANGSVPQIVSGTASDAASGLASVQCECPTCSPALLTAAGPATWSCSMNPSVGANVITARAFDNAGNDAVDTVTITRATSTLTATTASLGTATVGSAYNVCLSYSGGTAPVTWSKVSGTYPTGLSLSNGCIIGTPDVGTEGSYTNHVYRVTDTPMATADTAAMTLTVQAAASGPDAYYTSLKPGGAYGAYWLKGMSFKPEAGVTCTSGGFSSGTLAAGTCNPNLATQLNGPATTGYRGGNNLTFSDFEGPTYDFAADTHAQRQYGTKYVLPAFTSFIASDNTLTTGIDASQTVLPITLSTASGATAYFQPTHVLRIDNEILECKGVVGFDPAFPTQSRCRRPLGGGLWEINVVRAWAGTTAATHSGAAVVKFSQSGIDGSRLLKLPLNLTDGHTYFITWDQYFTNEWLGTEVNSGFKYAQLTRPGDGTWYEWHLDLNGRPNSSWPLCTGDGGAAFDRAIHVGGMSIRSYNAVNTGQTVWTDTFPPGNVVGPGTTNVQPLSPPTATNLCITAGRWTRIYAYIDQRANDWDQITYWLGDEVNNPVKIMDATKVSVRSPTTEDSAGLIDRTWIPELNDSFEPNQRGSLPAKDPFRAFTIYFRNLAVLQDINTADIATPGSGLLLKPLP